MPGVRTDGIRTLADFKSRFKVCEESGCWEWRGKSHKGRCAQVWLSAADCSVSIGQAIHLLTTGNPIPQGKVMRCICKTTNCGNPDHRKLDKRGKQTVKGIKRDPAARIHISNARRAASTVGMTAEKAAEIRQSNESLRVLAQRHGISPSYVSLIRLGKCWAPTAHGASVFSLAGRK